MRNFQGFSPIHLKFKFEFLLVFVVLPAFVFPVALVGATQHTSGISSRCSCECFFFFIDDVVEKDWMRVTVMSTVCGLLVYVNPLLHSQFVLCCVACSVLNGWTCYCICLYELRLCGTLQFTEDYSEPTNNNWTILTTNHLPKKRRKMEAS
jgi:hypothetical protein